MKIPNSIRIAGVEYAVKIEPHARSVGRVLAGYIDYEENVIALSEESNKCHERMCITLLHEVLHGIVEANGMQVDKEEAVVEMFARGLYQVLQDNGGRLFDLENAKTTTLGNRYDKRAVNSWEEDEKLKSLSDYLNHIAKEMDKEGLLGERDACRDAAYIVALLINKDLVSTVPIDLPSFRNLAVAVDGNGA